MSGTKATKGKKSKASVPAEALSMINQVARNTRTALSRHLMDIGLYAGQDSVMLALDAKDGQTPGAIAVSLGVKAPTITKTIGRLAAQGFVRRESSQNDGRKMLVFLTGAGRDQIKSVRKSQRRTEKMAFAGLKKKQLRELVAVLAAVDANIAASLSCADLPDALPPQDKAPLSADGSSR